MLKYTITSISNDVFSEDEDLREDKLYFVIEFPDLLRKFHVRSVPGFSHFKVSAIGSGLLPGEFEGIFTSKFFLEDAVSAFARNPRHTIVKTPKPEEKVSITTSKVKN